MIDANYIQQCLKLPVLKKSCTPRVSAIHQNPEKP